jgi:hypothetical protein
MKARAFAIAGLCGVVLALAFPAAGVASHVTLGPSPANVCGIDLIETET